MKICLVSPRHQYAGYEALQAVLWQFGEVIQSRPVAPEDPTAELSEAFRAEYDRWADALIECDVMVLVHPCPASDTAAAFKASQAGATLIVLRPAGAALDPLYLSADYFCESELQVAELLSGKASFEAASVVEIHAADDFGFFGIPITEIHMPEAR
jgi:hypothetical protein